MSRNLSRLCLYIFIVIASFSFPGCQIIGDIFKAGIWVGIIIVAAALALIALLIKSFKN